MARKTNEPVDEPVVGPQPESDDDASNNPSRDTSDQQSTSGMTFTAEGGTPATDVEFSDSEMVKQGEWKPETHGAPPDARPKRNY